MLEYYIGLTLLHISNKDINFILRELSDNDIISIFEGKFTELQMKYSLDFSKYSKCLNDKLSLANALEKAKYIIEKNKELKIKAISINDINYPINLKSVEDAPAVLYYKGRGFYKKHEKAIGCAGTRTPTNMGLRAVNSLVEKMVSEEFIIVSGLAEGIDTQSHKACLEHKGITFAVLAHGLDTIYPKENENLAEEILKSNGMLISEYPVGTKPEKYRFVNRNRIISGLSKGVIIFESKEKSGTMHTVNFATKQERKIFCPVPIEDVEQTKGVKMLIENKQAIPVATKEDYDIIITGTGYKIQKDKQKAKQVKDKNIHKILSNINIDLDTLQRFVMGEDLGKSGITVDKETYAQFKALLKENNLTVKDVFNGFLISIVKSFRDKK